MCRCGCGSWWLLGVAILDVNVTTEGESVLVVDPVLFDSAEVAFVRVERDVDEDEDGVLVVAAVTVDDDDGDDDVDGDVEVAVVVVVVVVLTLMFVFLVRKWLSSIVARMGMMPASTIFLRIFSLPLVPARTRHCKDSTHFQAKVTHSVLFFGSLHS